MIAEWTQTSTSIRFASFGRSLKRGPSPGRLANSALVNPRSASTCSATEARLGVPLVIRAGRSIRLTKGRTASGSPRRRDLIGTGCRIRRPCRARGHAHRNREDRVFPDRVVHDHPAPAPHHGRASRRHPGDLRPRRSRPKRSRCCARARSILPSRSAIPATVPIRTATSPPA